MHVCGPCTSGQPQEERVQVACLSVGGLLYDRGHRRSDSQQTEWTGFIVSRQKPELALTLHPWVGASLDMDEVLYTPMARLETLELFAWDLLNGGLASAVCWLQMLG